MTFSSNDTRQLARRLLLALGAGPTAMVLPGCGCVDVPDASTTIEELLQMREYVRVGADNLEAGCKPSAEGGAGGTTGLGGAGGVGGAGAMGGAGGMGGAGTMGTSSCTDNLPSSGTGDPATWYPTTIDSALAWDPNAGCPTPQQFSAFLWLVSPERMQFRGTSTGIVELVSSSAETCVYSQVAYCSGGRPFLVQGAARTARLTHEGGVADEVSRWHAEFWLACAQMEHASVAAFARLTLQLMALGAPFDLVMAAQQASLDEGRHAELCLQEAGRYGVKEWQWGRLHIEGACDDVTPGRVLVMNIVEGCIGETLAAARARRQASHARPELARALLELADDEERHALLAWRILKWQLDAGAPSLRRLALETFRQALLGTDCREASGARLPALEGSGVLSELEARISDETTYREVVAPVAAQLLSPAQPSVAPSRAQSRLSASD